MNEPIIELKDVSKSYDDNLVIDHVNLTIKKGEFVTFLGPSGCGKTTTLRMIAGFDMPTSGQILLNGDDDKLRTYTPENGLQPVYFGLGEHCSFRAEQVVEVVCGIAC